MLSFFSTLGLIILGAFIGYSAPLIRSNIRLAWGLLMNRFTWVSSREKALQLKVLGLEKTISSDLGPALERWMELCRGAENEANTMRKTNRTISEENRVLHSDARDSEDQVMDLKKVLEDTRNERQELVKKLDDRASIENLLRSSAKIAHKEIKDLKLKVMRSKFDACYWEEENKKNNIVRLAFLAQKKKRVRK